MHFVLAGGSGYIGKHLGSYLINHGHTVTILTRNKDKLSKSGIPWFTIANTFAEAKDGENLIKCLEYQDYDGSGDVFVNLAGENMGEKRIGARRLHSLLDSRIHVLQRLQDCPRLPPIFFQASGVACYPNSAQEQDESSAVDENSVLGKLALSLEQEALKLDAKFHFKRYYFMRLGIVMSHDGGFMRRLKYVPPFSLMNGSNNIPFISTQDLSRAVLFVTSKELPSGPINFTAPNYATINEVLASCFKFVWLPPVPLINYFLKKGDHRMDLLLADQKIKPQLLLEAGFEFRTPSVNLIVAQGNPFLQ